jgi:hypothetical protein
LTKEKPRWVAIFLYLYLLSISLLLVVEVVGQVVLLLIKQTVAEVQAVIALELCRYQQAHTR